MVSKFRDTNSITWMLSITWPYCTLLDVLPSTTDFTILCIKFHLWHRGPSPRLFFWIHSRRSLRSRPFRYEPLHDWRAPACSPRYHARNLRPGNPAQPPLPVHQDDCRHQARPQPCTRLWLYPRWGLVQAKPHQRAYQYGVHVNDEPGVHMDRTYSSQSEYSISERHRWPIMAKDGYPMLLTFAIYDSNGERGRPWTTQDARVIAFTTLMYDCVGEHQDTIGGGYFHGHDGVTGYQVGCHGCVPKSTINGNLN